jgi:hypothetical protein
MRHISDKSCTENQNAHFTFNNFFFLKCAVNEIMWKNIVQPDRPKTTIWRMRFTCWMTKTTNTHSEYAKLIAFPRQQWLHENTSMLRCTYIACLVIYWFLSTTNTKKWNNSYGDWCVMMNVLRFLDRVVHVACPDFPWECISSIFMVN